VIQGEKPLAKKTSKKAERVNFEDCLEKVEQAVQNLEGGELGLSESLTEYESGVKHLKQCYQLLEGAERKIELLAGVDDEGRPLTEPYDDESLALEEKSEARGRRRSIKKKDTNQSAEGINDAGPEMDSPGTLF
jgi:exodeoxyribonuclease VII small subunit